MQTQVSGGRRPSESACRLLPSTPTISIYHYYLAKQLILILLHQGG